MTQPERSDIQLKGQTDIYGRVILTEEDVTGSQLSNRPTDWHCVICGTTEGVSGWPRKCWGCLNVATVFPRYVGDRQRNAPHGNCRLCGNPLPAPARRRHGGNRPRLFCSNKCRQKAYRAGVR